MSSVRLNKITRELNVGIGTLVEFLQKKGFEVENNPNAKISGEAYMLLVEEFGDGQELLIPKKEKPKIRETEQVTPEPVKQEAPEEPVVSTRKQQFKTLGKIDLDAVAKPKATGPKKEEKEEILPKEEKPAKTVEEVITAVASPASTEPEAAEKIKRILVSKGVKRSHITAEGRGFMVPVISNESPEGRKINRRVEMAVTANHKMIRQAIKSTKTKR
jgi:translation initiation factor IF-2